MITDENKQKISSAVQSLEEFWKISSTFPTAEGQTILIKIT